MKALMQRLLFGLVIGDSSFPPEEGTSEEPLGMGSRAWDFGGFTGGV